jgi:hypothetical protein
VRDPGAGQHRSLVEDGRTLLRRLRRSRLDRHLQAMVLLRPARGRSILYATLGNETLLEALAEDRHFCRDTALGGMLHPKRASFRELRTRPSLHIALEPHNRISVHFDREAPTVGSSDDGICLYGRARTARHIWRDVLTSLARPPSGSTPTPRHRTRPWRPPSGARPLWRFGDGSSQPRPPASPRRAPTASRGLLMAPAPPVGRTGRESDPKRGPPGHFPPHRGAPPRSFTTSWAWTGGSRSCGSEEPGEGDRRHALAGNGTPAPS